MSLLALAVVAALSTPVPDAPLLVKADRPAVAASRAQDLDIERALMELRRTNPERNVCIVRAATGSRQRRAICGTVERWFNARLPAEIADNVPPYQLVEEIKRQRRKAAMKGRGVEG